MRIETLSYSNKQTQGLQRREWLRTYAPEHLQKCAQLVALGLQARNAGTSRSSLVLGAGACTEVPLVELLRSSDDVALVDLDLTAMQRGRDELLSLPSQRQRVRLVRSDVSGGVSDILARFTARQRWNEVVSQGANAVFDAAAHCLEECHVPDPPSLNELARGDYGVVISSLILSQLFSYPLLDLLDTLQSVAPQFIEEQERHRRYQDAAQSFRTRVISAHLRLLTELVDRGGIVVLLSDIRGFVFSVYGTDHDTRHRRGIPLVPRSFFELVETMFDVVSDARWEWLTDLPEKERLGRGYEVFGAILRPKKAMK